MTLLGLKVKGAHIEGVTERMRVLVTGNLGYIGTVLTPKLVSAGYDVVGLDTGYYEECVLGALDDNHRNFKQVRQDVRDVEPAGLIGFDAIVHLAALSNDPTGELDPELTTQINYVASVRPGGVGGA